jgi:hypothetical protein
MGSEKFVSKTKTNNCYCYKIIDYLYIEDLNNSAIGKTEFLHFFVPFEKSLKQQMEDSKKQIIKS